MYLLSEKNMGSFFETFLTSLLTKYSDVFYTYKQYTVMLSFVHLVLQLI
jgi:hypothetical protein